MKDFLGQTIEVGDTLVYPVRRRSMMWLSKMTVTELSGSIVYGVNDKGRRTHVTKLNRCVVVKD